MLVRLLYASRAAESIGHDDLVAILKKSKLNNPRHGITGVLCFSNGVFLQALEGGRSQVSALYSRIVGDPRHHSACLLSVEEIGERRFEGWSMGQVNLHRLNPAQLIKYSESATLDPYAMPAAASLALLNELVASAAVIGQS
ncbi:BLUF domain-containing protein [Piscinibacter sakaiensis]|uniref:BLUF domain-containing protein n=1 Tax=Piscinibacter sakaiensis TaxID=1547922 RepID=UPI003AAD85DC